MSCYRACYERGVIKINTGLLFLPVLGQVHFG